MRHAFNALIADPNSPNVGGFPTTLVIAEGSVRFWPTAVNLFVNPEPSIETFPDRDVVLGDAAAGDFHFEVFTTEYANDNIVGVYFRYIEKALVFRRRDSGLPYATLESDLSPDSVEKILAERLGVAVWRVRIRRINTNKYEMAGDPPSGVVLKLEQNERPHTGY
jgi:hypothetical protein